MNNRRDSSSPYIQTLRVFLLIVAVTLASFYLLSPVLLPIIIAFTLYALFEPAVLYLVRQNVNRSMAILTVLVLLLIGSLLAIGFALPALIGQISLLQTKLPAIAERLQTLLQTYGEKLSSQFGVSVDFSELAVSLMSQSSSVGQSMLFEVSEGIINVIGFFILVPFITYFLLRDFKRVRNRMMDWLPNSSFEIGWLIYHNVSRQLQVYTRGIIQQSLIMAVVCSIGFSLIGIDIPILLGCLTGLLNLIPYIGPIISILLSMLVAAAMTPFEPSMLYLCILVVVTGQIIDNVVVIPALIGNAVNLHPVQVILGIIVIGGLFGTLGVILAIPAIATAKIVYNNLYADILNASRTA